jgi:hypothetical protein
MSDQIGASQAPIQVIGDICSISEKNQASTPFMPVAVCQAENQGRGP